MARPNTPLWDADEHTIAKHRILHEYLVAWLPIMSRRPGRLLLIDGFAGPGRYLGGEEGSPLVMLRALLDHTARPRMGRTTFTYLFIEQDKDRFGHLVREIQGLGALPANVKVVPVQANFADVMGDLFTRMKGFALAPTFAFIDPFGYKDTPIGLTGQILSFPRCEALIYVPLYNIARFVDQPAQAPVLTGLYGDSSWTAACGIVGFEDRQQALHDLFATALRRHAKYVRSFEMMGRTTNTGYHLFFASSHPVGLRKMKAAMWHVDRAGGTTFRDSTVRGQTVLFEDQPDFAILLRMLQDHFGTREFTIEEAEEFTLLQTPFRDDGHLKTPTLKPAEEAGLLEAWKTDGGRRRGTSYPAGTALRFKPQVGANRGPAPAAQASGSTPVHPEAAHRPSGCARPTA